MRGTVPGLVLLLASPFPAMAGGGWPAPPCPALPESRDASAVLAADDASAILGMAGRADLTEPAGALLRAHAAALLLADDRAIAEARRYLAHPAAQAAHDAWSVIGAVELRRGHFAAAAEALGAAAALTPAQPPEASETQAGGDTSQQALELARALAAEPPPRGPSADRGTVALVRDAANLQRALVSLNGRPQEAVIDTGANFSVMVRSRAEALGLRVLDAPVTVASPVSPRTPARLAIADRLEIAGAEFRGTVFLVLPDEALSFAGGAYRIEAIVGFPVLRRLGRLTFAASDAGEQLGFERGAAGGPDGTVNLVLDGNTPKVLACAGVPPKPLQLALDSGAAQSSLRPQYAADFGIALDGLEVAREQVGGAGGTIEQATRIVPKLSFTLGDVDIALREVTLSDEALREPGDHGRLGQDVLGARGGYVIDFERMQLIPEVGL